jgi:hypothetical protein
MFCNMVILYGEELLARRPTPKLVDHPLSAVRDWLCNVFAATFHIWRPFLVTGTHLSWASAMTGIKNGLLGKMNNCSSFCL